MLVFAGVSQCLNSVGVCVCVLISIQLNTSGSMQFHDEQKLGKWVLVVNLGGLLFYPLHPNTM